ncbi:uncharacterized protein FA14DRAFT_154125 [Meira miltonrushii]|uniref:Cryptic loci regulator 2 N-terminal domain-containing protein n=1 Tax=Meira miltonrushii TaxID=1280837 RepID=A0A316VBJ7_9BASI|nr:uncharacterized protein FA14DRAFT_154125 [Meira miltonrushii]PWN34674.1 hypothetical protein FA14DRAFT_154125 [Meira miltonrushii]
MGSTTPSVHESGTAMASSSALDSLNCNQSPPIPSTKPVSYTSHPKMRALIDVNNKTIQFTRSDAHECYIPTANGRDPAMYKYIYTDVTAEKSITQRWRKKVGSWLASSFELPGRSEDWIIESFPANYSFVKMEATMYKGHNNLLWRLYGGKAKICFQSPTEFNTHAEWLLTKDSEHEHCLCKRCHGPFILPSTTSLPIPQSWTILIQRQLAPQSQLLPGVPIESKSVLRSRDLGRLVYPPLSNNHEGFRLHEIAFVKLSTPVNFLDGLQHKAIDEWPVQVTEVKCKDISGEERSAEENGNVKNCVQYIVTLLGSDEKLQVEGSRLRPAIGSPLLNLSIKNIVCMTDVQRRINETDPQSLNLENDQPRASIRDILCSFLSQILVLAHVRNKVVTTDSFNNQSDWDKIDKTKVQDVTLPAFVDQEKKRRKSVNFAISEKDKVSMAPPSVLTENGNYAGLADDDDSSSRRRREPQKTAIVPLAESKMIEQEDNNTYWAGMFVGFERVWVGDVVRLNLEGTDIRRIIDLLVEKNKNDLSNRMDKSVPDLQSPIVMQIKAIFQKSKDTTLCIAGDLYRIVNKKDANRSFKEFIERSAAHSEQGYILEGSRFPSGSTNGGRHNYSSSSSCSGNPGPAYLPLCETLCKTQLPGTKNGQLPPSPKLPEDFGYQKVNQPNVEIVVGAPHIAGRLYCSMVTAETKIDPITRLASRVRELQFSTHSANNGSVDGEQIRIRLAGLLPGSGLTMGVQSVEPFNGTRLEAWQDAAATAAASLEAHLQNARKKSLTDDTNSKHTITDPTTETRKRKLLDADPSENDGFVKRSKGEEIKITLSPAEHKINVKPKTDYSPASTSQADTKMEPLDNQPKAEPYNQPKADPEPKQEDSMIEIKPVAVQTKVETAEGQHTKIHDFAPPGFLTRIDEKRRRIYYINPNTRESVWGRKVKKEEAK